MNLLLCLCLFLYLKFVFSQISCRKCPLTSSSTINYYIKQGYYCGINSNKTDFICCVSVATVFKCEHAVRKRRSDKPKLNFFFQLNPQSTSNNHFQSNPFLRSLTNYQSNFPTNQFGNIFNNSQQKSFLDHLQGESNQNESNHFQNQLLQSLLNNSSINQNYPFFQLGSYSKSNPPIIPLNFTQNSFLKGFFNQPTTEATAEESFFQEFTPVENPIVEPKPIRKSENNTDENLESNNIRKHKNFKLLPSKEECGIQVIADRIFDGSEAGIGEFPWMALLEYSYNGKSLGYKCGGTLINSNYVLTAAHCVLGKTLILNENLVRVRLGEHALSTEIDCNTQNDCNEPPQDVDIEEIILHHAYNESNKNIHNDIALIRLNKNVVFSDFVKPICLPFDGERTMQGKNMTVCGWGARESGIPSNIKLTAEIPYMDDVSCKKLWEPTAEIIDSQFCAGGNTKMNACRGDSGGPIMSTLPQSEHWYVEGIVSFGKGPCGGDPFPSVYTRVSSYINWIFNNIKA